jgi:hypothetical protein
MNNNNNNTKSTLFYSKRCPHCAEIMMFIEKSQKQLPNFSDNFNYTLVDGNRNLPPAIKSVPSMHVPDMGGRILVGTEVKMYLETCFTRLSQNRRAPQPVAAPSPAQTQADSDGILGYLAAEMSGFGDMYSYIDGDSSLQTHCYEYIDSNGNKQQKCEMRPKPRSETGVNQGMTASQQHTIRLQQQARQMGNGQMPVFQDPTRQPLQDRQTVDENDYERLMQERNNDPNVPQYANRLG